CTPSRCSREKSPSRWACTAITSIRTSRCGVERSMRYSPASRRSLRSFAGVTAACGTPVTNDRRVLTSTKTRVVCARATMASSPCSSRRLRSTICQPQATRWSAARSSPARPSSRVVISRTRGGAGAGRGLSAGREAGGVPGTGARLFMPVSLAGAFRAGKRPLDPGDDGVLWRRGRAAPEGRAAGSGQGDVLLVELLDVDVLEGHHPHRAHEAVGAVDVPHPHVRQAQLVEHLAAARADLQVHLVGEVEATLRLHDVREQADHVAVLAEELELEVGLVVLEILAAHRRSSSSCRLHGPSHSTPAEPGIGPVPAAGTAAGRAARPAAGTEPSRQLRRWCSCTPIRSIAARCTAAP